MKSEPTSFSLDDLKRETQSSWDGVRNFQARNFIRDEMRKGDVVFLYHSSCAEPAIVGLARVVSEAYPDHTAWDPTSEHFDPRSSPDRPLWYMVDIAFESTFDRPITLQELKSDSFFNDMLVVQKGQRLSIQPVSITHAQRIIALGTSNESHEEIVP